MSLAGMLARFLLRGKQKHFNIMKEENYGRNNMRQRSKDRRGNRTGGR